MQPFAVTQNDDPLGTSATWIAGLSTGSIAVSLAVLAVAAIGFQLLSGRLQVRSAARTLLGVFVLLGSGLTATTLIGLVEGSGGRNATAAILPIAQGPASRPPLPDRQPVPRSNPFDPYGNGRRP